MFGNRGQRCRDLLGLSIIPTLVTTLMGGRTAWDIALKFFTRLLPLWFAGSRCREIFDCLSVAEDLELRLRLGTNLESNARPSLPRKNPRQRAKIARALELAKEEAAKAKLQGRATDNLGLGGAARAKEGRLKSIQEQQGSASTNKSHNVSRLTLTIKKEQNANKRQGKRIVPWWLSGIYVATCFSFCVFSLVRVAMLRSACASSTLWEKHCFAQAFPIFDTAIPSDACTCHSLMAVGSSFNNTRSYNTKNLNSCSLPRVVEELRRGLFGCRAGPGVASMYTEVIMMKDCALNNTHVREILEHATKLVTLQLINATSIDSPLQLENVSVHDTLM